MIKDNITYLKKPFGNVMFSTSDDRYFQLFGCTLIKSFNANVVSYDCLYLHIINPTNDTLDELKIRVFESSNLAVSYEYISTKDIKHKLLNENKRWLLSLPKKILIMLALEQGRQRSIFRKFIILLLRLKMKPYFLISKRWLSEKSPQVFYACRRFTLISDFIKNVDNLIVIDIDSIFTKNIVINEYTDNILAKSRSNSWSQYLVGFVFFPNGVSSEKFVKEYSDLLKEYFDSGFIFWGIDQFLFDVVASNSCSVKPLKNIVAFDESENASFISYKGDSKFTKT